MGAGAAVALMAASGRLVPGTLYLVLLGTAALWIGYVRDWTLLRWPVALAVAAGGGSGTSAAATTPVAQSARPSTGGQIQADPATNSLIISAPEPVYRQLRQVIDMLDTRRAQIYVESMIVKVDASRSAEFGIQWQGLSGNRGDSTIGAIGTNFSNTTGGNILDLTAATVTGTFRLRGPPRRTGPAAPRRSRAA